MTLRLYYKRIGQQKEELYEAPDKQREVILGRPGKGPVDVDLLPDDRTSRQHAKLVYRLNTWYVTDLKSAAGTFLGSEAERTLISSERLTELHPGDILRLADTLVRVEFDLDEPADAPGQISDEFVVQPDVPKPETHLNEVDRLDIFTRISHAALHADGDFPALLRMYLDVLHTAFPKAEGRTILLIEDEAEYLVPRAFHPQPRSTISMSLARQVIENRKALHWQRGVDSTPSEGTRYNTNFGLYAPIHIIDEMLGVLYVDSASQVSIFSERDLQMLAEIATIMAPNIYRELRNSGPRLPNIPKVFISYSRTDQPFVKLLASELRKRGVKVWFDELLQPGQVWFEKLMTVIENVDAFMLIVSPESVASENVGKEIDKALECKLPLFPFVYRPVESWPKRVAFIQQELQYTTLTDDSPNFGRILDDLIKNIKKIMKTPLS